MKHFVVGVAAFTLAVSATGEATTPAPASAAQAETPTAEPTAVVQPSTVAILEPVAQQNLLRSGTEIPLVTREELTTVHKRVRVGQRFQMEVSANVEANGVVIIPIGTPAVGEVTDVRNKGMWGKSGYINARVLSLRLGDRQIRLTGTFDDKGVTGTAGVVGAVAFVPIAGFFMTGTSAKIPVASPVKAFLDEDIAYRTAPARPQVLEVPVAAPATVEAHATVPSPAPSATAPTALAPKN